MKKIIIIPVFILFSLITTAQGIFQNDSGVYKNPVLPGFHPDPSIIRVDDDYYLVTSSFEFWPALPVYHSKDLVNWELINYVVNNNEQIDMSGIETSEGFYAPTIRYNKGTFYVAVSYVIRDPFRVTNMVFTTEDIYGSWSNPHIITDGTEWKIDPDLFFDDDGKVYFSANAQQPEYPETGWRREIRIQQLDINAWKLIGEHHTISKGAMKDAVAVEAPHIYKKDGYYYLLVAEGGTGMGHAVTISRSKNIFGPYQSYRFNPIITHRHMVQTAYIQNTGHADIVQTQNGEWWMVLLGVRDVDGIGYPLGRETFLVPMIWEEGEFPIVNPGVGKVLIEDKRPDLPAHPFPPQIAIEDFETPKLPLHWNIIRNTMTPYKLEKGALILPLETQTLIDDITPAFVGRRLQHHSFDIITKVKFMPESANEEAGLSLMLDEERVINFLLTKDEELYKLNIKKGKEQEIIASAALKKIKKGQWIYFRITANKHKYDFSYSWDGNDYTNIVNNVSGKHLHTPGWVFTGTYVGLYATSNRIQSDNVAFFDWFSYRGLE